MTGILNRGVSLIVCFILFHSCNLDIDPNLNLQKKEFFFSTDKYFNAEATRLSSKRGFTKHVNFNGKEESMKLDTMNLKQEFIPFINSDINKVIWSDQYVCDSTFLNKQLVKLNCSCNNSKLKTQNLDVEFADNEVSRIQIKNKMSKMLMSTTETLDYQKDKSYQIKRVQKLRTSNSCDSTLVQVTF